MNLASYVYVSIGKRKTLKLTYDSLCAHKTLYLVIFA